MTIPCSRQGMAARPARALRPDRAWCAGLFGLKQRIRAWLTELEDEQLASFGLTLEDILVLRH